MRLISLLLLLTLTHLSSQACSIGCIRCNTFDECLLCDSLMNYVYNSATLTCVKSAQENCKLLNHLDSCLECNYSYFYNSSTKSCMAVEDTVKTENPNCDSFDSN